MSYKELKLYLNANLEDQNFFFRQRSMGVIERAEDILLSRQSDDLNEFAQIIHEEIKEHDNPEMLQGLRMLTSPFVLFS